MSTIQTQMIAPDIVDMAGGNVRLVAWRRADGHLVFPKPPHDATPAPLERVLLSPVGTLWSWTVQRFRPKSPPFHGSDSDAFEPFYLGYVEFPEGIIVEGRIDARVDVDKLRIGMKMDVTAVPIFTDERGAQVFAHAFRPVASHTTHSEG